MDNAVERRILQRVHGSRVDEHTLREILKKREQHLEQLKDSIIEELRELRTVIIGHDREFKKRTYTPTMAQGLIAKFRHFIGFFRKLGKEAGVISKSTSDPSIAEEMRLLAQYSTLLVGGLEKIVEYLRTEQAVQTNNVIEWVNTVLTEARNRVGAKLLADYRFTHHELEQHEAA